MVAGLLRPARPRCPAPSPGGDSHTTPWPLGANADEDDMPLWPPARLRAGPSRAGDPAPRREGVEGPPRVLLPPPLDDTDDEALSALVPMMAAVHAAVDAGSRSTLANKEMTDGGAEVPQEGTPARLHQSATPTVGGAATGC